MSTLSLLIENLSIYKKYRTFRYQSNCFPRFRYKSFSLLHFRFKIAKKSVSYYAFIIRWLLPSLLP